VVLVDVPSGLAAGQASDWTIREQLSRLPQFCGPQLIAGLYWKWTPNFVSVRQITLQVWAGRPGKPKRNVDGISKVAAMTREAPDSVKLRTVHGSTAFFPRIIVPDLWVRRRGVSRRSAIG